MTLDTIISLISTVALVYFCVGTFRIDRKLGRTNALLESIKDRITYL